MSDTIASLARLGLVTDVTSTLQSINLFGGQSIDDTRDMAEYLINLVEESINEKDFIEQLSDQPSNQSIAQSIFHTIQTGLNEIKNRKSVKQSNGHSVKQSNDQIIKQPVDHSCLEWDPTLDTKHTIKQPNDQTIKQEVYSSRKRPRSPDHYDQSNNQTIDQSISPFDADGYPSVNSIHIATITSIKPYGCFAQIQSSSQSNNQSNNRSKVEGLIHASELGSVNQSTNQSVYVKVVSKAGNKLGLSCRSVDQSTGEDIAIKQSNERSIKQSIKQSNVLPGHADLFVNPSKPFSQSNDQSNNQIIKQSKNPKNVVARATSPERWEMQQLKSSGVANQSNNQTIKQSNNQPVNRSFDEDFEEEADIELNDELPAFLRNQSINLSLDDPSTNQSIKLVNQADGPLSRAALTQSALSKERREMREQAKIDHQSINQPTNLSKAWEDPMASSNDRHFHSTYQSINRSIAEQEQMPAWKRETAGKNVSYGRAVSQTVDEQRKGLPVYKLREELLNAVKQHQILVVIGETGSGKTTQMTQYLVEEGFCDQSINQTFNQFTDLSNDQTNNHRNQTFFTPSSRPLMIGCTQPRRVAAVSVAKRVAEEVGCKLGAEVGYSIRFEDCTSPETKIKYMTDGMMMRELLLDPDASKYSVLILDEAHERTINTDVLFGLMKAAVKRRNQSNNQSPLRLIVTSATLDAHKFSKYFNNCPIFSIPGRLFPVTILYSKKPEPDYLEAALITVMQIHLTQPPGDVLLFLTGKEEIDTACEILFDRMQSLGSAAPELLVLPVYSALPSEMQTRIFEPAPLGKRKCVIATNIAEASLTIDGILYVVDPGFVKQKLYNSRLGMDSLVVTPISQASAAQRAGRAGRTGPGKCFRLYTEAAYQNEMLPMSVPEIQRTNLSGTVLQLKAMGINDLLNFDFMDPPPVATLVTALQFLYNLAALDDDGLLTKLGRRMAEFPLEPSMSKMLLTSLELGCSQEVLSIVSMLSIPTPFFRPKDKQAQADAKRLQFFAAEGDHFLLLNVFDQFNKQKGNPMSWAHENFLQGRSLKQAGEIRKQLLSIFDRYNFPVVSCGAAKEPIQRSVVSAYFMHAAKKSSDGDGYQSIQDGQPVYIHPSSTLFHAQPQYVVYHQLVLTVKEYMRECIAVHPNWLVEHAPKFFKTLQKDQQSKRKKREKIQPLFDPHHAKDEWRLRNR